MRPAAVFLGDGGAFPMEQTMDEMVAEKLKAMGIEVTPELASLMNEYKRRQDAVRPAPLSLDAIVVCSLVSDLFNKKRSGGR